MPNAFRLPDDPKRAGADVRQEIELYLDMRAKEFEAKGLSPEDARAAAVRAFGDRAGIEAECTELRGEAVRGRRRREWLSELRSDVRVAVRGLLRTPAFTITALLTLALGLGANTAIFSVVRSVLLRPLPYTEPERLVQLWTDHRALGRAEPEWLTSPDFMDWQAQNRSFERMTLYQGWGPDLTGDGKPEALTGWTVTWPFFEVFGAKPALGRVFRADDDLPGAERVVVMSDGLWRRRFGADPAVAGKVLQLNGEAWTVIGVMPKGFRPPATGDLWRPLRWAPGSPCGRGCIAYRGIGRLKPGVSVAQAQTDIAGIAARLAQAYPKSNEKVGAWLVPLHEQVTGPARPALLALGGAVAFVLLIACVNLANLLLVRATGRTRELAVRAALGAGRGRLLRQLLTESLVLALAGGILGLGLGWWASRFLGGFVPAATGSIQVIQLDGAVVAFTVGLTLAAGIFVGIMPALRGARPDLMNGLRSGSRETGHSGRLRQGLVVAQLALALVLLAGAGLLLRSFLAMQRVELGYRTDRIVLANLSFPAARYPTAERAALALDEVMARLRAERTIRAVEVTDVAPLTGGDQDVDFVAVGEQASSSTPPSIWYRKVTPGYFSLMGVRLVAGRAFTPEDRFGGANVIVVNQEAAKRYWPGIDPVGRQAALGGSPDAPRATVVGVVATTRHDGPSQPVKAEMFMPLSQFRSRGVTLVVDPTGSGETAIATVQNVVIQVDPMLPLSGVTPLEALAADAVSLPRLYAMLVAAFGAAALALATIGVYGVMAFMVAERRREMGVRLALGAAPATLRRLVVGQGIRLVAVSAVIGLAGAAVTGRLIRSLLFEVGSIDIWAMGSAALLLSGAAVLASWLPAERAARTSPLEAIREG